MIAMHHLVLSLPLYLALPLVASLAALADEITPPVQDRLRGGILNRTTGWAPFANARAEGWGQQAGDYV